MYDSGPDDPDRFLIFATQENLNNLVQWHFQNRSTSFLSGIYHPLFMSRCSSSDGLLF